MNTETAPPEPSTDPAYAEAMADLEAVCAALAAGRPIDPVLVKRVRERSERSSEEIFRREGLLDIAVPAIRELRDS